MGKFNKGASTNLLYILNDWIVCWLAFALSYLINADSIKGALGKYTAAACVFIVVYIITSKESRLYNVTTFFYLDRIIRYITRSWFIALGVTSTLVFYVGNSSLERRFYLIFVGSSYIGFLFSAYFTRKFMKNNLDASPRTLFVGGVEHYDKFIRFLGQSNQVVNNLGFVSLKNKDKGKEGYIGHVDELERLIHENSVDQVYIMQRKSANVEALQDYITICKEMGVTVRVIVDAYRVGNAQCYVSSVGTYPVITYHTVTLNKSSRFIKRCMDILGGLVGALLSLPIIIVAGIAIKIEDPGPVFFLQERVGMNGRHFKIYKLRSMCVDAEAKKAELMAMNEMGDGFMFKMEDDPRVTKVGKFIRKTSIDELPQFFNVLKGDMSLVGTRPPTVDEVNKYERMHWRRISIKPGITGMWQASGRSEIKDFDAIVDLDTEYIDQWSVLLDIKIMIKTVLQVLRHKGAC